VQFFKIVRVLAWEADAADYYADIRHQLSPTGRLIGEMDMMIAAHALAIGAVLVTNNTRDFDRIAAPLSWVTWCEAS
jgi:tRNA(fMet)-specific endonuclease VapC